jgi:VWFA-related protein
MQLQGLVYRYLAIATLTAVVSVSLRGQSAEPQAQTPPAAPQSEDQTVPSLVIRKAVRRVIVDVTVRDHAGKPVHGLAAKDFSISEDNHPQQVLSFDAYDFDKPSLSRGRNAPPLPPNMFVNVPRDPERGPLYVMLLDLVNTEMEDQIRGRQQVLKFIRNKPPGTRFAIFATTDKLRLIQGFTDDKDLLDSVLDSSRPKSRLPRAFLLGDNYGRGDPYTSLDMLTHVGQYLDGIPGRKNLIWVAGQFNISLFPREEDPVDLQANIRAEVNALAQAQVAVFPVDVRGVVVNPEGALTGARPNGGASNMSDPGAGNSDPSGLSNPTNNPVLAGMKTEGHGGSLNRSYSTADAVASMTGGRAFYSDNDVAAALTEATEEGGNYYTVTYAPPGNADDGKCHNIVVKVDQPGYQLSYRRNYCHSPLVSAPPDEIADQTGNSMPLVFPLQAGDVLQGNMRPGAPMLHDLIFSARLRTEGLPALATPQQMAQLVSQADYYRTHRKGKSDKPIKPVQIQQYSIDYRVLDPQFKARAARGANQAALEFAIAAFDADGHVLNGSVNDATPDSSAQSGENKSGLYRVHQELMVPKGAVSIRVGVRDRSSDRMGTLEVPLPLKPEPVAQVTAPK